MKYNSIEEALKDGYTVHVWRSGAGLRVLNMKKETLGEKFGLGEAKTFYGEGTTLYNALRILTDDVIAGGRKYNDVYGVIETHYITGSYPDSKDELDVWLASGRKFDISCIDNEIVINMTEKENIRTPEEICQRVYKGERVFWKVKDSTEFFNESYPERLANGTRSCCTGRTPPRNGNEGMISVSRITKASTLEQALKDAINQTKPHQVEWIEISKEEVQKIIAEEYYSLHTEFIITQRLTPTI